MTDAGSEEERIELRPSRTVREVIAEIREGQRERGYVPPSREEVDRYLTAEKESWDR
jgi:hypothetical protein